MTHHAHRLCAIGLVALALSATRLDAQQGPGRVTVKLLGYNHLVTLDTLVAWSDVVAPAAETYAMARQTIGVLKLPVTGIDSTRWLVANTGFKARTSLAGHTMSWAFRCGSAMTGDYADTARLSIAYAIFVEPTTEGHSRLGVALISGAETVDGASRTPWDCISTGRLEQEIVRLVRANVATR